MNIKKLQIEDFLSKCSVTPACIRDDRRTQCGYVWSNGYPPPLGSYSVVNYGKKCCVALPAHPFIHPTILSLALADSHLALMGVHTLITSSDSHADIEEI